MNTEKPTTPEALREERLRENAIAVELEYRAKNILRKNILKHACMEEHEFEERYNDGNFHADIDSMIEFLKSDASKQYHASEPVDLEKLKEAYKQRFIDSSMSNEMLDSAYGVFSWFIPFLHPTQQDEIDRLEAELKDCTENYNYYVDKCNKLESTLTEQGKMYNSLNEEKEGIQHHRDELHDDNELLQQQLSDLQGKMESALSVNESLRGILANELELRNEADNKLLTISNTIDLDWQKEHKDYVCPSCEAVVEILTQPNNG